MTPSFDRDTRLPLSAACSRGTTVPWYGGSAVSRRHFPGDPVRGTMEPCMRVMLLRVDSSLIWHASMHVWVYGAL